MIIDAPTITISELSRRYGAMPTHRLRLDRYPAEESDVLELHATEKRLYELKDGLLLEKTMGVQESFLAMLIGRFLGNFVDEHDVGFVLGSDGMIKLDYGLIRIPDVSFFTWDQFPERKVTRIAISEVLPDLAIEVLSVSNTVKEMEEKLDDYFEAGIPLVWMVDPELKIIKVYTSRKRFKTLTLKDTLDGGKSLPGFQLPVKKIFARI